jgi:hypothetical protein
LVAKQPSPPRAVVISHITAALFAIIKKKFQDPVRKEKPLIGDKPAVFLFKMTDENIYKIKLIEYTNGIFKIEKMSQIHPGIAEI